MPVEPGKIRNVAVVGHRSTGKTSLVEAMLYQAGAINRLGTIEAGNTTSDWDDDEQTRQMMLTASLAHLEWQGRKINLIDTPGDPGFQGDMIAAIRVVEGALVVVSAVMGVEVQTSRAWQRAGEYDLSRVVVVNMLDRERADFFRTLEALRDQLSDRCVAVHLPIGSEHELTGVVDLLHMKAYTSPEGERDRGLRLQDHRRPVRRPHQPLPRRLGGDRLGLDTVESPHARQGARRPAAHAAGQGAQPGDRLRSRRHRRSFEAQGHDHRGPVARSGARGRDAANRLPRAGDELRGDAQGEGRRGEG